MIHKLTKAELKAEKIKLDAWIDRLIKVQQFDNERRAQREDRLIDRNLMDWG